MGQHLDENHIASFADLSPSERLLFIDRASKTIQSGMQNFISDFACVAAVSQFSCYANSNNISDLFLAMMKSYQAILLPLLIFR